MGAEKRSVRPSPAEWESLRRHPAHLAGKERFRSLLEECQRALEKQGLGEAKTEYRRGMVYAIRLVLEDEHEKWTDKT